MRRGEQCAGEQPAVDGGFVLPDVEYAGKAASQQGRAVHDLAARGVQDYGAGFHPCKKGVAGHAARRVVERRVERQDVGLAGDLLQRQEAAVFARLARRVAAEDPETPCFGILLHERSDVSHADDAQRTPGGLPALRAGEVGQHRPRPLEYASGVAAGGRADADAVRRAPRRVDVVETDGRRGDQTDAGAAEQPLVAAGARADKEGVGVAHLLRRDFRPRKITHLGPRFEDPLQEGYGAVGDDFHG